MRGIYVFPNLFTAANLAFGFMAIALLMVDEPANLETAAWLILFANVFDALDGRVARLLKTSSQFGEEFDSLADLVSFGVAPACLMLKMALRNSTVGMCLALLFVLCGAARLARFNVMARQPNPPSYFFVGCPIPAASTFLASCALYDLNNLMAFSDGAYMFLTGMAALLMVSTVPYPKKRKEPDNSRRAFYTSMAAVVLVASAMVIWKQDFIFLLASCYILSGILWKLGRETARLGGFLHRRRQEIAARQPGH